MSKLKILQINTVVGIGSTGRIATDLHNKLEQKGFTSYVAYGRGKPFNISLDKTIKIGNKASMMLHILITRLYDKHGFGSKIATKKFIKKISKMNFDIIHIQNLHGYYLNIKILFKYLKTFSGKVVWTFQDVWPLTNRGATIPEKYSFKNGFIINDNKKIYPKTIFFTANKSNINLKINSFLGLDNLTIITPSQWLKEIVEKSYLKNYSSRIINNGIDLDVFNINKNKKSKMKKRILFVSNNWNDSKGLEVVYELSKLIEDKYEIMVIGLDSKQLKTLPSNLIGIQKTNDIYELVNYYNEADYFLNPTTADNFPTVNLESLACGTPVITFNTGGSPEAIDANTGIISKNKTAKSLFKAINEMETWDRENTIINCRKRAENLYNKEDRINDYIKLYEELLMEV